MENLLDYLLYALFGHNVTEVWCSDKGKGGKTWFFCLEESVCLGLDETDLKVIRSLYEERYERLDGEERARYNKIFNACV